MKYRQFFIILHPQGKPCHTPSSPCKNEHFQITELTEFKYDKRPLPHGMKSAYN
jgi:hypothetical protein